MCDNHGAARSKGQPVRSRPVTGRLQAKCHAAIDDLIDPLAGIVDGVGKLAL